MIYLAITLIHPKFTPFYPSLIMIILSSFPSAPQTEYRPFPLPSGGKFPALRLGNFYRMRCHGADERLLKRTNEPITIILASRVTP